MDTHGPLGTPRGPQGHPGDPQPWGAPIGPPHAPQPWGWGGGWGSPRAPQGPPRDPQRPARLRGPRTTSGPPFSSFPAPQRPYGPRGLTAPPGPPRRLSPIARVTKATCSSRDSQLSPYRNHMARPAPPPPRSARGPPRPLGAPSAAAVTAQALNHAAPEVESGTGSGHRGSQRVTAPPGGSEVRTAGRGETPNRAETPKG